MTDEKFFDELSSMINDAFHVTFGRKAEAMSIREKHKNKTLKIETKKTDTGKEKDKKMNVTKVENVSSASMEGQANIPPLYESIREYTNKTGKRFRMTKDQKQRNLTRDEAFSEFTQIEKDLLGGKN